LEHSDASPRAERPEGWGDQVRYVRRGWEMAERIKPLMSVRWEEGLD
jgi:ubiquinone biosynthesis protein Coq4